MRDFAETAIDITKGVDRAQLDSDKVLRYAVLHVVSILGEAAGKLSADFREAHGDIPWGAIIGTRNRLIHGYDVVDLNMLWDTIEKDLPHLLERLSAMLGDDVGSS